ncbi:MAG: hypothetical protein IPP66_12080 [Anaerolineales bacterium]|nr:hypothetical protein [Anaerolineales bacterium]
MLSWLRVVLDPVYRSQQRELTHDFKTTCHQVENWAVQGNEFADPNRRFAILSFTNIPMHAKFHGLVAKGMQFQGYTPVIFTRSGNHFAHSYYRLFRITQLEMWDQWEKRFGLLDDQLEREVEALLPAKITVNLAKELVFHGVHVGEHALSMTCRRRVEGRLNLQDVETFDLFRLQLKKAIQNTLTAEKYLDQNPIEKMLVRDAGYIPSGPIFEVALNHGVDCVVLEFGQRRSTWIFKRYTSETRGRHYFSLSPRTWENIKTQPWGDEQDKALEEEFTARYRPDSMDDTRRLQSGKQVLPPSEVYERLGLDPGKKTAVIFSHVAWDAAFFFGSGLFDDFEDWLFQTVQFVSQTEECRAMNWIVKEHPFNMFKLQREKIKTSSERRLLEPLMPLPEHVRFMPAETEINTRSLFPLVDCVLTVNGTVGMEFPCFGIPAVLAGTGRYNGFGFTMEPSTREEYFATLRNLHKVERLSAEVQQLARQHFYALVVGKQISFDDIAPMELKRIHEAQSDVHDNINITARSLDDLRASPSLSLLADWLANSREADLILLPVTDPA